MTPIFKIYARRFEGVASHVPFLAPWWGEPKEDDASLNRGQFSRWAASRPTAYFLVATPAEADVHVLSIPWKATRDDAAARDFAAEAIADAASFGRRIVIFFDSDHDDVIDWPEHAVVFRFSLYRDTRRENEFAIPTFSQDLLKLHYGGVLHLREKAEEPSVSFCGYAPPLGGKFSASAARETVRYLAYRLKALGRRRRWVAHAPRVQALRALRRAKGIETRFVVRDQFAFNRWGVLQPGGTPQSAVRQREEFVANLDGADYALCARGLANCSIRLYEALSLGRIPLFVNTQCVLPYEWLLNWRTACVCVDETDLSRIGEILREDHARSSPEEFAARQRLGRALFERWIRPEGFFAEMHRHFPKAIKPVRA